MKKILLFSRDPGAANCLIPVYKKLKQTGKYQLDLYGKDFALNTYGQENIKARQFKADTESSIKKFLQKKKYDLILTGTSSNDFTDRLLWKVAQKLNISTIAILDQWMNYKTRFSWGLPGGKRKSNIEILPDKICIMDKYAQAEMLNLGFPKEKLIITGQPYFETILACQKKISQQKKQTLRKKLRLQDKDYVIVFASEPIAETYKNYKILGYNEIIILNQVIINLNKIVLLKPQKKFVFLIKLHPRNRADIFNQLIKRTSLEANLKIKIIKQEKTQSLIAVSDLIIGMSSMFLLETALMKRVYLSVQIGLKTKDPFVLSRRGFCKTILSSEQLFSQLKQIILQDKTPIKKFTFIPNASEKIVDLISQ